MHPGGLTPWLCPIALSGLSGRHDGPRWRRVDESIEQGPRLASHEVVPLTLGHARIFVRSAEDLAMLGLELTVARWATEATGSSHDRSHRPFAGATDGHTSPEADRSSMPARGRMTGRTIACSVGPAPRKTHGGGCRRHA